LAWASAIPAEYASSTSAPVISPQAFKPASADCPVDFGFADDRGQGFDGPVHRRTQCAGGTVDLLQCGRQFFQQQHGVFGSQGRVCVGRLLDFSKRFLDALNRCI